MVYRGNNSIPVYPPAPLLPVAVAVIIGIIISRNIHLSAAVFISVLSVCVVGVGVVLFGGWFRRDRRVVLVLLCVGFGGIGGLRYRLVYNYYPAGHIVSYCKEGQGRLATLRGTIVSEPYITKSKGTFARYDYRRQASSIFVMDCDEVMSVSGWRGTTGRAQVVVSPPRPDLEAGQKVELYCWLALRHGPDNPGQPNRVDYYRASGNLVSCRVNHSDAIRILSASKTAPGLIDRVGRNLQAIVGGALLEDGLGQEEQVSSGGSTEGFLSAVLLGKRYKISGETNELFMRTGTIHFLSLSGMHIGLLTAFVWWGCRGLKLPRWLCGVVALCFIGLFLLIVPPRAPVLRAGIISAVFCVAYMTRRTTSGLNLLSFGAVVILLWRPLDLFSAGFQLSFIIVLGLLLFASSLYKRILFSGDSDSTIASSPDEMQFVIVPWWREALGFVGRYLWGLVVVSLVAWFVGMPLAAYHFNRIALCGAGASVILFPLISVILLLGLVKIVVGLLLPIFGAAMAGTLEGLSRLVMSIVAHIAEVPYSSVNCGSPPLWFVGIFYALLIGAGWQIRRKGVLRRGLIYCLLIWGIAFVWLMPFGQNRGETTIHVLSIGHGTATVIELPDGKVICYDAGSKSNFNAANYTIMPFLRSRGINRIDTLFISHANIDHFNAVLDLCGNFDVGVVYISDYFEANADGAAKMLLEKLKQMQVPVKQISRGVQLHNPQAKDGHYYQIEVLWPPGGGGLDLTDANNASLIIRIADANGSILLCGDIAEDGQKLLLTTQSPSALKADILLLPHHGSITTTLPAFVGAVDPDICLNSCPRSYQKNIETLSNILPNKKIFHTAQSGAISVRLTPAGPDLQTFH